MIEPLRPLIRFLAVTCILVSLIGTPVQAGDWPQWRYNLGHGASTPDPLPQDLQLQWVRQLPRAEAAWPVSQHKLRYDLSYEPVVLGKLIFVPSTVRDSVTAFDTETGQAQWRFYTGGPVRFAPTGWEGKLYVVSDDGYLYCLEAETGKLLWKFRGGPSDYKILGNERLISMWPARGAPVVHEGKAYFAASIWPFMGTFIHALDAGSGEVIWTNSGSASDFILQPHSSPAFAGVGPQGYLSVFQDKLFVAGGRSVPAVYDRHTGKLLYYHANTKRGGYAVYVGTEWFYNDDCIYRIADGKHIGQANATVLDDKAMYSIDEKKRIRAQSLSVTWREVKDSKGKTKKQAEFKTLWTRQPNLPLDKLFIKAGSQLYAGSKNGLIAAVNLPQENETRGQDRKLSPAADITWHMQVQGEPWTMLAADDKLFVVTVQGSIYCFGARGAARVYHQPAPEQTKTQRRWDETAWQILRDTDIRAGYALVLGAGTGQLAEALVRHSDLQVIGLDSNADQVDRLRQRFDRAGLYGKRISILQGTLLDTPISPYLASLVVAEDLDTAGYTKDRTRDFVARLFHVLRPYGGTACLPLDTTQQKALGQWADTGELAQCDITRQGDRMLLRRVGALPDSAPWTHQYADVSNTVFSPDKRVKGPLGLLWFGGPSHLDVLPRHGHGPSQQVIGGRLFVQGINVLSARDVYTGRVIWRKELPELNTFNMYYNSTFNPDLYDRSYNQKHIPGANAWGSNFVVAPDRLYLIMGQTCLALDPATGDTLHKWTLEEKSDIGVPNWGYIGVHKDLLIAGTAPFHIDKQDKQWFLQFNHRYATGSRYITVLNRYTGKVLWERKAVYNFRHNTIIAGQDTLFCIDGLSPIKKAFLTRRGLGFESKPRVLALDARTGQERWSTDENVFGTWLGYSEQYDVLLQAGARAGDRAPDEISRGMCAYRGTDGQQLWRSNVSYDGPPILYHDRIITQTGGSNQNARPAKTFQLLTGQPVTWTHPLTGQTVPWQWIRFKGCNTAVASEHLLTFRSASGAYIDMSCGMGTTSLGGFKSGCTSNLIVADGVLNAPDYTRTCTCSYQNQTSLALVHFPEDDPWYPSVESWSFDFLPAPPSPQPVKRIGINFGAAGNRRSADGTLWLEYPSVGGPSPDIPIQLQVAEPRLFRYHASRASKGHGKQEDVMSWVGASGIEGVETITIRPFVQPQSPDLNHKGEVLAFTKNALNQALRDTLADAGGRFDRPQPYTVRLYFANVQGVAPGQRVFDVTLQDRAVLKDLDIAAETSGGDPCLVKEFRDVPILDTLRISLSNRSTQRTPTMISGVELIAEASPGAVLNAGN